MMRARSARDQVCHGAMENGWRPLNVHPGLRNSRSMPFCSWSGPAFGVGIVVVRLTERPGGSGRANGNGHRIPQCGNTATRSCLKGREERMSLSTTGHGSVRRGRSSREFRAPCEGVSSV